MLIISLITFLFSISVAESCEITFYPKVYITDNYKSRDLLQTVKSTTCADETTLIIAKTIATYNGTISTNYLASTIAPKLVQLSPPKITITRLQDHIKKSVYSGRNAIISNIQLFNPNQVLALTKNQTLRVDCNTCSTFGSKSIQLTIHDRANKEDKTIWVNAHTKTTIKALVSLSHLAPSTNPLRSNQFILELIQTSKPTDYFIHKDQLLYHKINKPILKGAALKNSDLSPFILVSPAQHAEVVYKSPTIKLQGTAIPRQRGKHGDMIQLSNPRTGKIIFGKVVGKNKVLVQL